MEDKGFTSEYTDLDHLFGKWFEDEFQEIQWRIDPERKTGLGHHLCRSTTAHGGL